MAKSTKGKLYYGRRLRGSAKRARGGPVPSKHKRRVKWEAPFRRCECHHSWPCPNRRAA
jgi:hypothetical protein